MASGTHARPPTGRAPNRRQPPRALLRPCAQEVSLADYKGKYLVLFFYPLDFT